MFWPHGQPSMRGDPLNGGFPGIIYAEIVDRAVRPHDLYAPDLANLHRQQDRGQTFGWFILWRHRQDKTNKTTEIKNGAARVVPRRPTPASGLPLPERSRVGRAWVATLSGAILLFWGQKPVSTGHRPIRTWPSSMAARRICVRCRRASLP